MNCSAAKLLGILNLVIHPGAHHGYGGRARATSASAAAIDRIHRQAPEMQAAITLEVTAGQGTVLASKFEHFATILEQVDEPERLGFCLDTCHLLAAGYDFRTRQGYDQMMDAWETLGRYRAHSCHPSERFEERPGQSCRPARAYRSRVYRHSRVLNCCSTTPAVAAAHGAGNAQRR